MTLRQNNMQTDSLRNQHANEITDLYNYIYSDGQGEKQTGRQEDQETKRRYNIWTDREIGRQTKRPRGRDGQTDRQAV